METAPLKSFATWARTALIREVNARISVVLAPASAERVEQPKAIEDLEEAVMAAGGGDRGKTAVADRVAYTWFNRIIALRFMDANGYTGVGIISPQAGVEPGQPEILAEAKRGNIDAAVVSEQTRQAVTGLLNGTRSSGDPQGEAYALLLAEYCRYWNRSMPFMFEREGDFTELLIPANLLADESVLNRAVKVLTTGVCQDVEVIGWIYQFYISERKDEVFAGFKKNKKAGAAEIPAATQLFTPHWIVRYLVENSLGRLWLLNRPNSRLADQMDYYIAPVDEETAFVKITRPEDLKVIDPACGSGHMLSYAFDLLYSIYEEEGYAPSDIPRAVLANNLYGTEIDPRAGALAAFALTMKARAKQRTFFNQLVEPNVCVIEPISFRGEEIDFLATRGGDRNEEAAFWNQFAEADTVGSLIRPDSEMTRQLGHHLTSLNEGGDLLTAETLHRAERVHHQAEHLIRRHHVVVANPPYMGNRNMDGKLAGWLGEHFSDFRMDLFSAFVRRCAQFAAPGGRIGVMSPNVWMYISSHQKLREFLCLDGKLESLLELPLSGFKDATVQICAYTFAATVQPANSAVFLRLLSGGSDTDFGCVAREAIATSNPALIFVRRVADFGEIPGIPVAYWLYPAEIANYNEGQLLCDLAEPKKGMDTGDNNEFLRLWWEVSWDKLAVSGAETSKWFPYNKGGGFRRWYGNREYVINWADNGAEIRSRLSWLSRKPTLRNLSYMKRDGFTWGTISSGGFSARYTPPGALFDNGGCTLFSDGALDHLGALMNSSTMDRYLEFLAPTLNFQPGDIGKVPVPRAFHASDASARRCVEIAKDDWDRREDSFDFQRSQLLDSTSLVRDAVEASLLAGHADSAELQALESANNAVIADVYGLSDIVPAAVPIEKVTLSCNPAFRFGRSLSGGEMAGRMTGDLVTEFVSYAVGCIFGRYSLDEPGLILVDQGSTLPDYLAKVPSPTFAPAEDNVVPIVDGEWFEDDIVARFRTFLRAAFGPQHFEENLRFVTESLGVNDIRDYFVRSFYEDHWKRYKKRPIYWLFSSPKGSFNALIYMHRYAPSTASTVLNEYLREFQAKLSSNLQQQEGLAAGSGTPRQQAAAQKEADRLRKVLLELEEYEHDVLYPLASRQLAIDLDDGVKANYQKFGAALKKIAGLGASDE
jgi:hypothetical protein